MKRLIVCILFAFAAGTLGSATYVDTAHAQETEAKTASVTLAVKGMVTPNCPVLVKTALNKVKGVKKVAASLESKTTTVEYDPGVTSVKKIRQVIKDQVGFETEVAN